MSESFLHVDLDDPRLTIVLDGVRREGDALTLAPVHGAATTPGGETEVGDALTGVAGIGVGPDGAIYVADTDGDRVLRIPACGGDAEPVGCLELDGPRGVVVGPRDALYVADTGNHRVVVVDLATEQVRTVWGQRDRFAEPRPGREHGELDAPWDLAADARGRVYVVDHGNRRIQRFDAAGRADPAFAATVAGARAVPREPTYVATVVIDDEESLLVFDRTGPRRSRLLVYDLDGGYRSGQTRRLRALLARHAPAVFDAAPAAIAAAGATLYVADATTRRVLAFDADGGFVGATRWQGHASGLAVDADGRLLVHPGTGAPTALAPAAAAAASGTFLLGPVAVSSLHPRATLWRKLSAQVEGAHVQLSVLAADDVAEPAPDDAAWRAAPPDAASLRIAAAPARYLWIAGRLTADGDSVPGVRALRLAYDGDGWLRYLPAVYAREESPLLEQALDLFEDALDEQEETLAALPRLLGAATVPVGALPWLAGWLAWELEQTLSEADRRASLRGAFRAQGLRGTAEGLRELVHGATGADVRVVEAASSLTLWQLGSGAGLGFGTRLAAAGADGAVLGSSELGAAALLDEDEYAAALVAPETFRYCVQAYAADLSQPGVRERLERLVAREQPAGTEAHVCVIEPRARVGAQATLGVDAVVGRAADPWELGASPIGAVALPDDHHPASAGFARVGRATT